jgi:hypothetical protein
MSLTQHQTDFVFPAIAGSLNVCSSQVALVDVAPIWQAARPAASAIITGNRTSAIYG